MNVPRELHHFLLLPHEQQVEAIRKVFGEDTPTIDPKQIEAEERLAKERLRALQAKISEAEK